MTAGQGAWRGRRGGRGHRDGALGFKAGTGTASRTVDCGGLTVTIGAVRRSSTAAGKFGPVRRMPLPSGTTTVWKLCTSAQGAAGPAQCSESHTPKVPPRGPLMVSSGIGF
jgi:L-aminopeptidase/D-esterase-like protein